MIGHSNEQGLQLANGTCGFKRWPVVAEWLASFEPKDIVLVACEAARFEGAKALFEGIKSLGRIFGSPIKVHVPQIAPLIVATVTGMNRWKMPEDLKTSVQIASFLTSKGILYCWMRQGVLRKGNIDRASVGSARGLLQLAYPIVPQLSGSKGAGPGYSLYPKPLQAQSPDPRSSEVSRRAVSTASPLNSDPQ